MMYLLWKCRTRRVFNNEPPFEEVYKVPVLHDHGIQTEEGLHRPWRSASFESSIMVAQEDLLRAQAAIRRTNNFTSNQPYARLKPDTIEADGTRNAKTLARVVHEA